MDVFDRLRLRRSQRLLQTALLIAHGLRIAVVVVDVLSILARRMDDVNVSMGNSDIHENNIVRFKF